jgi:hypothetical protein
MEIWKELKKVWNRVKTQDKKFYSTILISLFLCSIIGFILISNKYTSFANAEVYSMTNNIFFEATALGKSTPEVIHLEITEQAQDFNTKPDPNPSKGLGLGLMKDVDIANPVFSAKVNKSPNQIIDMYGVIDSSLADLNYEGFQLNMSNCNKAIMASYTTGTMLSNLSDYQENFNYNHNLQYKTSAKSVFFAEPHYYEEEWCLENDYTPGDILNSTYTDSIDYNQLNDQLIPSQLVSTQVIVTSYTNYYSPTTLARMGLKGMDIWERVMNPEEVKAKCPWLIGIILVIAIAAYFVGPMIISAVLDSQRIQTYGEMAKAQIWADMNVTVSAINAERDIQLALTDNMGNNEALVLSLWANGTISFEDCQMMLKQIDGNYAPLINNRTMNIQKIGRDYYNHTLEQWDKYENAIGLTTNWTNYLDILIYVFIGLIVFYVIYTVVLKRKGNSAGGVSSNVFFVSPTGSGSKVK